MLRDWRERYAKRHAALARLRERAGETWAQLDAEQRREIVATIWIESQSLIHQHRLAKRLVRAVRRAIAERN